MLLSLVLIGCNQSKSKSDSVISPPSSSTILKYWSPASSPSSDPDPVFEITYRNGGFNGGAIVRAYQGSNCQTLIASETLVSYTTAVALTVTIGAPGTYQFSVDVVDPFVGTLPCSNTISYTYDAPAVTTSIDLLSAASPSANPNPNIRVNGLSSHNVEVYLNSSCSGTPFYTSSNSVFILPPLNQGTHEFYVKALSTSGVRSLCSPKLLTYQSTYNFGLDLEITINTKNLTNVSSMASADVDNDGIEDIVMGDGTANSGIYFGNGTGGFAAYKNFYFTSKGTAIKIADVDGDGDKDVLMGTDYREIFLFTNNGGRTFTKSTVESLGYEAFDSINYIEFMDVNNDGHKDIVVGAPRNSNAYIKLSNGNGTYQTAVDILGAAPAEKFQLVDINHDTYPDILVRGASDYKIYLNNGSASFSLSATVSTSITYGISYVEDMNGDAWPDIITADGTNVKIRLNDTIGGFGTEIVRSHTYSLYPNSIKVTDFDGDGNKDLLFYDVSYKSISIFTGNGDGTTDYPLLYPIKSQGQFVVLDLNSDSKKDVYSTSNLIQN